MEYYLHIKPTFNCLIKAQNLSMELNKNRLHSFLLNCESNSLPLSLYPLNNEENSLPYSLVILLNEKKISNSISNADLVSFPNNNLLLIVKPFNLNNVKPFNIKNKSLNFCNQTHNIYWNKFDVFTMRIENSDMEFIDIDYPCKIFDVNFKTTPQNLFIHAKTIHNTYVVCIVEYNKNSKYKVTTLEEVDLLEKQKDDILTFKNTLDIFKHGYRKIYSFSPNFSVVSELVYSENDKIIVKNKELIPFAFFDCIKAQNYDLAREYMSPNLSQKLNDIHLKKYFGEFIFSFQSLSNKSSFDEIALIYENDSQQKYAKIYNLEFDSNNKISNITLVGE